jgi:curved DNA-binding protein CbpA
LTKINEAYNILKDSGRRARYDSSLTQGSTNANRSKPTETTTNGRNGKSLTKEEQRVASRNKDRYRRALESNEMIAFSATIGLELYRQQAIRELQDDRVQTAKLLIQRFLTATS